jgi:reductive dehalogenase
MGELSRGCLISLPEHGPMVRKMDFIITDFPLAPTKPIDAGMYKFCHTCAKCAEHCPTGSIPLEKEPVFDNGLPWNNPGVKAWFNDYPVCNVFKSNFGPGYCGVCIACCPFTKQDVAGVHEIVRAGMSTLPMLHNFTRAMDDVFGYGKNQGGLKFHESDNYVNEWWNTIGPEYGLHTYEGI